MSNLGWYQKITTASKKVGGPLRLLSIVFIGGYIVIRIGEAGVKKCIKLNRKHRQTQASAKTTYVVHTSNASLKELPLNKNDRFHVLAADHDAVLIEKIGDPSNPYYVSAQLLHSISDYA